MKQPREPWSKDTPGRGVAAIAEDFTAFLAMDSRKLKVLARTATSKAWQSKRETTTWAWLPSGSA